MTVGTQRDPVGRGKQNLTVGERNGAGVAVVYIRRKAFGEAGAVRGFGSQAAGFAGIGEDTSGAALYKAGYLYILLLRIEKCKLAGEAALGVFTADARLVVPAVFRQVSHLLFRRFGGDGERGNKLTHHVVLHERLHNIGRHLHIVSPRFISFGYRNVGKRSGREGVTQR